MDECKALVTGMPFVGKSALVAALAAAHGLAVVAPEVVLAEAGRCRLTLSNPSRKRLELSA